MKSIMFVTKVAAITVLVSSSVGFADLASLSTANGNAAADALTRIAASKHFEGANIAALDPGTNLEEDLVYYSTLDLKTDAPDLSLVGGAVGAGGGGLGWTDPGDNGVIGGGGGGGSGPTDNPPVGGGRATPSPGAALLALIGMCCVGGARRRV